MKDKKLNVAYLNALYIVKKTAIENKKCRDYHRIKSCGECSLYKTFCKANLIKEKVKRLNEIKNL